jgi:hypothetical protein
MDLPVYLGGLTEGTGARSTRFDRKFHLVSVLMILAEYGDTPGAGGRGCSRKPWLLRVAEVARLPSRGSIECPGGRRVSALPGAPPPARARGATVLGEDH